MERGNQQGWAGLQHLAQLQRYPQPPGSHTWGVAEQNGRRQMWDVWESHANHPSWVSGKGMGAFPEQGEEWTFLGIQVLQGTPSLHGELCHGAVVF